MYISISSASNSVANRRNTMVSIPHLHHLLPSHAGLSDFLAGPLLVGESSLLEGCVSCFCGAPGGTTPSYSEFNVNCPMSQASRSHITIMEKILISRHRRQLSGSLSWRTTSEPQTFFAPSLPNRSPLHGKIVLTTPKQTSKRSSPNTLAVSGFEPSTQPSVMQLRSRTPPSYPKRGCLAFSNIINPLPRLHPRPATIQPAWHGPSQEALNNLASDSPA